ncbi:MAG: hypothetical protein P4K86_05140 [Terracidiphilus sp.]|nr:hypothetical protein [Terracidiphilus sp.]MDR3775581.1 hypothetical protein [Terracidiphilus sp.]
MTRSFRTFTNLLLIGLVACLFSVATKAATPNSASINVPSACWANDQFVPAGDYRVTWTVSGSSAQVTLVKSGVAPITVSAKVVEEKRSYSAVSVSPQGEKQVLKAILLKNLSLVL